MKKSLTEASFAILLGLSGLLLIGWFGDWRVALGVFLLVWSNNI